MALYPDVTELTSCSFSIWYDTCNDVDDMDSCVASGTFQGVDFTDESCMDMEALFYDTTDECTWDYQTGLDCLQDYAEVPGLTYCEYETYVDSCTGEEDMYDCYAYITIDGVDYEDWCEYLVDYFGEEPVSCEPGTVAWDWEGNCELDGLDICYAMEGYDCDSGEYVCEVSWTYEGQENFDTCDQFDIWYANVFNFGGEGGECLEVDEYECTVEA